MKKFLYIIVIYHFSFLVSCSKKESKSESSKNETIEKGLTISNSKLSLTKDYTYYYGFADKGLILFALKFGEGNKVSEAYYKSENDADLKKYEIIEDRLDGEHQFLTCKNGNHEFSTDLFSQSIVIDEKELSTFLIYKNPNDNRSLIIGTTPSYLPILVGTQWSDLQKLECTHQEDKKHPKYPDAYAWFQCGDKEIVWVPNPKVEGKTEALLIENGKELIFTDK